MTKTLNRGIINKTGSKNAGDSNDMTKITDIKPIDFNDKEIIKIEINDFAEKYAYSDVERALVISPNGNAYNLTGNEKTVYYDIIGKEALKGSISIHNHPVNLENVKADSFSFDDVYASNKCLEGKQYLISGTRRDAYEFREYYPVEEIESIWDKALKQAWLTHRINGTIVEFEQQDVLRELGKYLKGFDFYENF